MTRDQDNLFLFSYGGKSDMYVQAALRPQLVRITKSAILTNTNGTWQMFFDRDIFAGVYKIKAILRTDMDTAQGTLRVLTETRSVNNSRPADQPDLFVPHIDNYTQAAFSRYQTCTIEFLDPYTDATALTPMTSAQDYYVDLLLMPDIAVIQDNVLANPALRAFRYDDLVRAPIPVLVSISMSLILRNGDTPNLTGIAQAISDRINQLGFRNSLSASYAIETAQDLLDPESSVIVPIDMLGELIDPVDGGSILYRSASVLTVPEDYTREVSSKTLMFFCDPINVFCLRTFIRQWRLHAPDAGDALEHLVQRA
jgi:hypothetical protein